MKLFPVEYEQTNSVHRLANACQTENRYRKLKSSVGVATRCRGYDGKVAPLRFQPPRADRMNFPIEFSDRPVGQRLVYETFPAETVAEQGWNTARTASMGRYQGNWKSLNSSHGIYGARYLRACWQLYRTATVPFVYFDGISKESCQLFHRPSWFRFIASLDGVWSSRNVP